MICFFPFTHITEAQRQILGRFFSKVRVLDLGGPDGGGPKNRGLNDKTPSRQDASDTSCLEAWPVSEERAAQLEAKLAEYLSWAQLHRGNERNLKQLLKASPYFKSDTDLTSIKSQIAQGCSGQKADEAAEKIINPGLFLKLAQTLDRENEAIAARLKALDQGKESLLAELKGELAEDFGQEKRAAGTGLGSDDQGLILPDRRVQAWMSLAEEAGMFARDKAVFVTTSQGIFDWLSEQADGVINGLDIDPIKVHENECENRDQWSREFNNLFDQISAGSHRETGETLEEHSDCCHLSGQIRIRLFSCNTLNRKYKIPGSPMMVCLVGLNS